LGSLTFVSRSLVGEDIFKLGKFICPINEGNHHWTMAVVFLGGKSIQFYDSCGGSGDHYVRDLFQYLQDEHLDKKGTPLPDIDKWTIVGATPQYTPRQRNGEDCGVFVCMLADFLAQDFPLCFGQGDMPRCRERIAMAILQGRDVL
jgi:sentrin-specific protease 1